MIQRIQSIFLLLASVLGISFSFLNPSVLSSNFGVTTFAACASLGFALMSLVGIFLFKNRSMQLRVVYLAFSIALVSIVLLVVYFDWRELLIQWPSYLLPASLLSLLMARRGIKKDNALIKSLDRLR